MKLHPLTWFDSVGFDDTTGAVGEFGSVLSRGTTAGEKELQLPGCWGETIRAMTGILCFICNIYSKYPIETDKTHCSHITISKQSV